MHRYLGFAIIFDIILFDQFSKWVISERVLRDGNGLDLVQWIAKAPERVMAPPIPVTPFLNWVMVWNEGISFGVFNNGTGNTAIPLIILSLIVCAVFLVWLTRSVHPLQSTGIGLVVGGALGNVIDRARFGAVMDFVDVHAYGFHWPAFNLADSAIVIGVGCLLIWSLFYDRDKLARDLDKIEPGA